MVSVLFLPYGSCFYPMAPVLFFTPWFVFYIYPMVSVLFSAKLGIGIVNVNSHGITSICVLTDIFITGMPLRLMHVYHGILYAMLYIIFTVIYDVSGGTNSFDAPFIYDVLNWTENPGVSLAYGLGVAVVGIPIIWLLLYGLYRLRVYLFNKYCMNTGSDTNCDIALGRTGCSAVAPSAEKEAVKLST